MKRKFTILTAALMLLAFLAVPLGMRGQSDYSSAYTSGSDVTLTGGTNGSACEIIINSTTYNGIKVGTSKQGGTMTVTVPAGTKYLHVHTSAWNGVTGLSLNITPNDNISPTSIGLTANTGIANNSPFTWGTTSNDETPNSSNHYQVITFTNALQSQTTFTFTTSTTKRFVIWGVNAEAESTGPTQLATPTNFLATAGNGQATFTWNAVANASGYTISYTPNGGSELFSTINSGSTTSTTITDLTNDLEYTCKIKADGDGTTYTDSEYSSTINVTPNNPTLYTVTLNAGNGTVNGETTISWNVSMNNGDLPDAVAPCNTWDFGGWSTSAVSTQTTTAPTFVPTHYIPTSNTTLYAVYTKIEGVAFDGNTGGDFLIYYTTSGDNPTTYYAQGTSSKLSTTTNVSEATIYTFEKMEGAGNFAIKSGAVYLSWSSGANFSTSNSQYAWHMADGTYGTWRPQASGDNSRSIAYRTTNVFGPYSASNLNGTEYFDIEIGGGTTTYYHSTPDCMETVATPTFDTGEGTYYTEQLVLIECETDGATIYYTLNGEDPTNTVSATNFQYDENEGVEISTTTTLKAKAFKTGMHESATASATYTIIHNVEEPTLPASLIFTDTYSVSITVPANTTVYYTTDGATPSNTSGTQYSAAFTINATTTVKAIAYDSDGCASDVVTATYTRHYTLAQAKALYDGEDVNNVTISLAGVQFIAKSGSYTYVQQGTDGLLIFGTNSNSWTNGDVFTAGTVTGKITKYGQNLEMTNFTFANVAKEAGSLTPSSTGVGITDITSHFSTYEDRYVALTSLEMSLGENKTLSDGINTLAIYDCFNVLSEVTAPDDNVVVNGVITSYYKNNSTTYQIIPLAKADITTGIAATLPTLYPVGGASAAEAVSTATVTVTPATSTTVTYQFGENIGEITSATVLTVPSPTATALEVVASRDFYTDNTATYYYKTDATTHDVKFYVNGTVATALAMEVLEGSELGNLPTATAPNGYTFMGWTESTISGIQASAPTMVTSSTPVNANMNLNAVFALEASSSATLTKMTSSESFAVNDRVVIVAENNVAMYQATISNSYVNKYSFDNNVATVAADDKNWFTVSAGTDGKWKLGDATNGYLYSSGSNNLAISTESSTEFTLAWDNDNDGFTLVGNGRWLSYRSDLDNKYFRMGGATTGSPSGTVYFDIYKYNSCNTSYDNYCTTVTILSGNITATATHTGACAIDEAQGATIKSGVVLTTAALGNTDPDALLIEEGGQLIHNNTGVMATMRKHINGYTSTNDNYYLIASPFDVEPTAVTNMLSGDYDLYEFDYWEDKEWQNYEQGQWTTMWTMQGYLYANSSDTDLEFAGEVAPSSDNAAEFYSYYSDSGTEDFNGWALAGNPFACNAYPVLQDGTSASFYKINGDELELSNNAYMSPLEGIFIKFTDDETVYYFNRTAPSLGKGPSLDLTVSEQTTSRGNAKHDVARIRFDQGNSLEKFQLNPDHMKIYIPQEGKDYAVVCSQAQGQMPINFKAAEDGTYTISVATEGLEVSYLHLIDNFTGNDVDLLQTPSYTFNGKRGDIANRFRLVFNANSIDDNHENGDFAFVSDGQIVILNGGEATLRMIDMLGRVVSTTTVNGSARIDAQTGVYVLQLVNGTDVKTQKIVVR